MAMVALSMVLGTDVATYFYARGMPGMLPIVAIPLTLVTLGAALYAFRALRSTDPA